MTAPKIINKRIIGHLAGWGELHAWSEVAHDGGTVRHFEMYEADPVAFCGMMIGGIALVREVQV